MKRFFLAISAVCLALAMAPAVAFADEAAAADQRGAAEQQVPAAAETAENQGDTAGVHAEADGSQTDGIQPAAQNPQLEASADSSACEETTSPESQVPSQTASETAEPPSGQQLSNGSETAQLLQADQVSAPPRITEDMVQLTITYLLPNGKEAAAPYCAFLLPGSEYSIPSPQVTGYTPDTAVVEGTMGETDADLTVRYTINTHTLTIHFDSKDSDFYMEDDVRTLKYGEQYTVKLESYKVGLTTYLYPSRMSFGDVMGDEDKTYTITYKYFWSPKLLTFYFKDDKGNTLHPTLTVVQEREINQWMQAPEIPGYYPEERFYTLSEGSYTFVYHKNQSTTVPYTVQYFREQQDGSYALDHQETLEAQPGTWVVAEMQDDDIPDCSPDLSSRNKLQRNSDYVQADGSTILRLFYYERVHTLTVHYRYLDGRRAAEDKMAKGTAGAAVSVESPAIAGYLPDQAVINDPMGDFSSEITVYYNPRTDMTYTVNYYWVGDKTKPLRASTLVTDQVTATTVHPDILEIEGYTYKNSDHDKGLTISGDESKNVINLYYCMNASVSISGESDTVEFDGQSHHLEASQQVSWSSTDGSFSQSDFNLELKQVDAVNAGAHTPQYTVDDIQLLNKNYFITGCDFRPGTLTITPKPITVQLQDATKVYGAPEPDYKLVADGMVGDDDESLLTCTYEREKNEALGTYLVTPVGAAVQGNYAPTFLPAWLTITKGKMKIIIVGSDRTYDYDGRPHSISGFDVSPEVPEGYWNVLDRERLSYSGNATITRTEVGTTTRGLLDATLFSYDDPNVDVEFDVTYSGCTLTINKIYSTVIIIGNKVVAAYDGNSHSVSGFTMESTDNLLNLADIQYLGSGIPTATGTAVGTYYMGLKPSDFRCTNENFSVNIGIMSDGELEIQMIDAVVHIFGNTLTTTYNGAAQTVSGWTYEVEGPAKDTQDWDALINYRGIDALTKTFASDTAYAQYLDAGLFECLNENLDVVFVVDSDGWLKIDPLSVDITIKARDRSKVYDGTPLEASDVDVLNSDQLQGDDHVVAVVSGSIANVGTSIGTVESFMIVDAAGNDVTSCYLGFTLADGTLTVTPKPVTVTALDTKKAFGDPDPTFTAIAEGLLGTDTVTYTLTRTKGETSGTYSIIPSGAASQGNYKVTYVPGTFAITKVTYDMSGVSFADQSFTYDGTVRSLTISGKLPEGVTVSYVNNDQANAGSYRVIALFTGDASHEAIDPMSAILSIAKATYDMSGVELQSQEYVYDGQRKSLAVTGQLPAGVKVYYENNGQVNAGVYTVNAVFTGDANHEAIDPLTATLTIAKAAYDMGNVTFASKSFTYDGTAHALEATGLPTGLIATYENNSQTNVGTYTVTATFTVDAANYEAVSDLTADLTINPKPVTVQANDNTKVFGTDDPALTATVTGLLGTDTAVYSISRAAGETYGTYAITPAGDKIQGNYEVTYIPGTFTITKAIYDMSGVVFLDQDFIYNGQKKSLVITGQLPTGVKVRYENNGQVNAGVYTVTAVFTGEEDYETPEPMTARLTIAKARYDMSGVKFANAAFTYDGASHSITATDLPSAGIAVSYEGNGQTNVGAYLVIARFAVDANHETPEPKAALLTIEKAVYDMSGVTFSSKSLTYNGKAQSLKISGTLPAGVTVSYSGSKTTVGSATVTATFATSNANYEAPAPMKATVTIKPMTLTSSNVKIVLSATSYAYTGKAKTPTVTVTGTVGGSSRTLCSHRTSAKGTAINLAYASGRKNVGTYKITITGTGNYTGTITKTFKIVPKKSYLKSVTPGSKKLTVKMSYSAKSRTNQTKTYYQIAYRQKGTSTWKYAKATSYQTKTLTSLKKGKQYYVKVRAYKTVNGTKYYGAWSTAKLSGRIK